MREVKVKTFIDLLLLIFFFLILVLIKLAKKLFTFLYLNIGRK